MRRIWIALVVIALLLGCSTTGYAAHMGDSGENLTLTIEYTHDQKAVTGAPVKLYKVASMDNSFQRKVTPEFYGFRELVKEKNVKWDILADALLDHILVNQLPCDQEATINTSGKAFFPTGNKLLKPGIYLLYCPNYRYDGNIYYASPVIISLPNFLENGQLSNTITAKVKFYTIEDTGITIQVKKHWEDKGYENKRPDKITVELLENGKTVPNSAKILSNKNKWTAQWSDLNPLSTWDVKEHKVNGYGTPNYSWNKYISDWTCTITNTYQTGSSSSGNKLPQTGQLDWPIPWMAVSGMVLFTFGWWLCFGRKDYE